MWKQVLVASTVLAMAGSSFVYAQRAGGPDGNNGPDRRPGMGRDMGRGSEREANRWQPSAEDICAFTDARIAGMKAGLKMNPDQEKNWPAFETAYRGLAQLRADRMAAMRDMREQRRQSRDQGNDQNRDQQNGQDRSGTMMDRMQRGADAMAKRATAFKQFADAAAPLYKSLDDGQKRRFGVLAHMLRPQPMRFARGMDRNFERGFNQDFGPGGQRRMERGFDRPRFGGTRDMPGVDHAANMPPADLSDVDLAGLAPDMGPDEH